MNNSVPYLQNNETFNPLFAKMRERFCADGTLAERMAVEAGLCKKRSKKHSSSEYHMTHGNSLPRHEGAKRASSFRKTLFSLKSFGSVSMSVLIMGILFFSGATFEGMQKNFLASNTSDSVEKNTYIISETEIGTLYFADESLPDLL